MDTGDDGFLEISELLKNHIPNGVIRRGWGSAVTMLLSKQKADNTSVYEIIKHYKMKSVSIVAHSFGGRVALKLAHKYGYVLDRLILIDSAGIKPRRGVKYHYKVLRHKLLKKLHIKHKSGSADYNKLKGVEKKTFINIVNEDLTDILEKITLPTLIIWGNKDKDTPIYMAKKLNRKLCSSGLVVIKDAGHFSYLDKPGRVLIIIRSFMSEG